MEGFSEIPKVIRFCSVVPLAMGVLALIGWHLFGVIHPAWTPIHYNAAVCFILCGGGLLAAYFEHHRRAAVCGSLAAAIGGLTLFQYVTGINLGIDCNPLVDAAEAAATSHLGRMSPNEALAFLMAGAGLVLND
jgi:hypothetical protein